MILIKGMEMPKRCEKCRCCKPYEKGIYCTLTITPILGNGNARLDNCPLVPVPPHGRLIDADALLKLIDSCMFLSDMVTTRVLGMATNWLKEAQTVIPADKDGEA